MSSPIYAGSASLSWTPPTENTDGTPLTDLAGYRIYYGCQTSGQYEGRVDIDTPGVTAYVLDDLPSGQCWFVSTAVNAEGVESAYSNVATKIIEAGPVDPPGKPIITIEWRESDGSVMAFPDDWNRRVAVDIQASEVDATLVNFPVLLPLASLPSEMFDADGSFPAQNGGGDIRVTSDEEGTTRLSLDVVNFVTDNNPASGYAELWVRVPSVSDSADTTIYVWYNTAGTESQPAADAAFGSESVWDYPRFHANEASGALTDAHGAHADLSNNGSPAYGVSDPFGGTGSVELLDRSTDYFRGTAGEDSNFSGDEFSVGVWINGSSSQGNWAHIINKAVTSSLRWNLFRRSGNDEITWTAGPENSSTHAVSGLFSAALDGEWHRLWVTGETGDPKVLRFYLDGVQFATDDGFFTPPSTGGEISLGQDTRGGELSMEAALDEIAWQPTTLSADWIAAEYSNQSAPGSFAIAGTPETPGGGETGSLTEDAESDAAFDAVATSLAALTAGADAGEAITATSAAEASIDAGASSDESFSGVQAVEASISEAAEAGDTESAASASTADIAAGAESDETQSGQAAAAGDLTAGGSAGEAAETTGAIPAALTAGAESADVETAISAAVATVLAAAESGEQWAADAILSGALTAGAESAAQFVAATQGTQQAAMTAGSVSAAAFLDQVAAVSAIVEGAEAGATYSGTGGAADAFTAGAESGASFITSDGPAPAPSPVFRTPIHQALTAGEPLPGATLTFSVTETETPTNTYADPLLKVPHPNPLKADAGGYFPPVYMNDEVTYRVRLDHGGETLLDLDPYICSCGYLLLTSRPYAIEQTEALNITGVAQKGTFPPVLIETLGVTGGALDGELRPLIVAYGNYQPESTDIAGTSLDGTLITLLLSYENYQPESVDIAGDALDSTLENLLVTYGEYDPESMDIAGDALNGTLV